MAECNVISRKFARELRIADTHPGNEFRHSIGNQPEGTYVLLTLAKFYSFFSSHFHFKTYRLHILISYVPFFVIDSGVKKQRRRSLADLGIIPWKITAPYRQILAVYITVV